MAIGGEVGVVLWQVLTQFLFRLGFGVALSMGITTSRIVSSGFFRVHLWMLMGFHTLASLVLLTSGRSQPSLSQSWPGAIGLAVGCAALSYIGAVLWLYEKRLPGKGVLWILSAGSAVAGILSSMGARLPAGPWLSRVADFLSSGLVLGSTLAAMLLGHWYLNSPGMRLDPLRRLVVLMGTALLMRAVLCSVTGTMEYLAHGFTVQTWIFLTLRWLAGVVGPLVLVVMTWLTLQVPNTQSATGILYAAVILTFIGELCSQLLSANTTFPL